MELQPHLHFKGNCEEALTFYQSVFGGEIGDMMRYKDAPPNPQLPPNYDEKIMHSSFKSGQVAFMASDVSDLDTGANNSRAELTIASQDAAEGQRLFDGLSAGGTVTVPYSKQFWGASFGAFTDKFGLDWMINAG